MKTNIFMKLTENHSGKALWVNNWQVYNFAIVPTFFLSMGMIVIAL